MAKHYTPLPSAARLRRVLAYDPLSGALTWKLRSPAEFAPGRYSAERKAAAWNARYANQAAFTAANSEGYRGGAIDAVPYQAHRIIWKLVTGEEPVEIDHENGDRANNRFSNLRSVTPEGNARNQGLKCTNKSGVSGVFWEGRSKSWVARIRGNGKNIYLGSFRSLRTAAAARKSAEKQFGFHPNAGDAGRPKYAVNRAPR